VDVGLGVGTDVCVPLKEEGAFEDSEEGDGLDVELTDSFEDKPCRVSDEVADFLSVLGVMDVVE